MKLKVTTHDLAGFDLSEIKHALTVEQKNELTLRLHKFASAKLVLNGSPNSVILHAVSVFRGEKGSSGIAANSYTHKQDIASPIWTVPHNLGRFPSVTVLDHLGAEICPDIVHTDLNIVSVVHAVPIIGSVYCI